MGELVRADQSLIQAFHRILQDTVKSHRSLIANVQPWISQLNDLLQLAGNQS